MPLQNGAQSQLQHSSFFRFYCDTPPFGQTKKREEGVGKKKASAREMQMLF